MNARLKPKDLSRFLALMLFVLGSIAASMPAQAQVSTNGASLAVIVPTNAIPKNSLLTYAIFVTNTDQFVVLNNVFVTNSLPLLVDIVGASNDHSGLILTNGTEITFQTFQIIAGGDVARMVLTIRPRFSGLLTNNLTLFASQLGQTNLIVINQVTNQPEPEADLAVSLAGPVQAVITNDYMVYGVTVSNLGPNDASSIMLTNGLVGMKLITNSLGKFSPAPTSSNIVFTLATLASGAFTNLSLTVQPTNAGPLILSASVGSASITDLNITNNTASSNLVVGTYLSTNFVIVTNSSQALNRQVGLIEQSILLSNTGSTNAASVRVVVSGLTNALYNQQGINNGDPFVVYGTNLAAGESVNLLLRFGPNRSPFPFNNSQLHAFEVPAANLAPPANPGTSVVITHMVQLASGSMLIEFTSLTNRIYTVVYSDNVAFSNALASQPLSGVAVANQTQWIDYGPPETVSPPTNTPMRFYRVFLNP